MPVASRRGEQTLGLCPPPAGCCQVHGSLFNVLETSPAWLSVGESELPRDSQRDRPWWDSAWSGWCLLDGEAQAGVVVEVTSTWGKQERSLFRWGAQS